MFVCGDGHGDVLADEYDFSFSSGSSILDILMALLTCLCILWLWPGLQGAAKCDIRMRARELVQPKSVLLGCYM